MVQNKPKPSKDQPKKNPWEKEKKEEKGKHKGKHDERDSGCSSCR